MRHKWMPATFIGKTADFATRPKLHYCTNIVSGSLGGSLLPLVIPMGFSFYSQVLHTKAFWCIKWLQINLWSCLVRVGPLCHLAQIFQQWKGSRSQCFRHWAFSALPEDAKFSESGTWCKGKVLVWANTKVSIKGKVLSGLTLKWASTRIRNNFK